MSAYFCGNPMNHEPHEKNGMSCEGINREEVKETIVEKFDPKVDGDDIGIKSDGTEYKKITILIEDANGDVTIVHAAKASTPWATAKTDAAIPLDKPSLNFYPDVTQVDFTFRPHTTDEAPAITIERKLHDEPLP